jgi:peroxiredoxin
MTLLSRFCFVAAGAAVFMPLGCAVAETPVASSTISTTAASPINLMVNNAVGKTAPDWTLAASDDKSYSLSKLRGQWVVLAFYPADMTAGCTLEARSLTRAIPEFQKRRAQVFGISVQDVNSKKKFCEQEGIKHPLLADVDKTVARSYGVLNNGGVANRVTYLIAPDGKVAAVEESVDVAEHGKQVLAMLDKARSSAKPLQSAPLPQAAPAKVKISKAVAPFSLPNYNGKTVSVGNWSTHKATVIMFVATQCPVSNAYNTRMANISKTYAARGVRFVGVNSNKQEAVAQIARHAKQHGFAFPVLKDVRNKIADRFDAQVTPEVFVVDSKGVLRYHGRIDDSRNAKNVKSRDLQAALNAILANKPMATKETAAFGCGIKRVG